MPEPRPDTAALAQRRRLILAQIVQFDDMRPGSLVHGQMKCGSPACRCQQDDHPGHGPYYVLVRNVDDKHTSCSLSASAAAITEAQIAEYQRFRRLSAELVQISEQLCDARLPAAGKRSRIRRKKACAEQFAPVIEAEVARLVSPDASDPLDFEAIEAAVRRQALQLAADAVARRLNRDRSDYSGPHRSCPCGREARYAGRLPKTIQSVVGPLTLERAYSYCDACGQGQFPRDRALGLEQGSLSPGEPASSRTDRSARGK